MGQSEAGGSLQKASRRRTLTRERYYHGYGGGNIWPSGTCGARQLGQGKRNIGSTPIGCQALDLLTRIYGE